MQSSAAASAELSTLDQHLSNERVVQLSQGAVAGYDQLTTFLHTMRGGAPMKESNVVASAAENEEVSDNQTDVSEEVASTEEDNSSGSDA